MWVALIIPNKWVIMKRGSNYPTAKDRVLQLLTLAISQKVLKRLVGNQALIQMLHVVVHLDVIMQRFIVLK